MSSANLATLPGDRQSMSSREIACLTGKEHKNVCRDVRSMLDQLEIDPLRFERIYFDDMNRRQAEYLLPKNECLTLVAGYNAQLRYRIINRWQELEQSTPIQNDADLMARALLVAQKHINDKNQMIEQQQHRIAADQPKVQFAEAVTAGRQEYTVRKAAKVLNTGERRLFDFLRSNGYLTTDNEPYQRWVDQVSLETLH